MPRSFEMEDEDWGLMPNHTSTRTRPTISIQDDEPTLAQMIRSKYPGSYDNVSDIDLETRVVEKYPVYAKAKRTQSPEARVITSEEQKLPPTVWERIRHSSLLPPRTMPGTMKAAQEGLRSAPGGPEDPFGTGWLGLAGRSLQEFGQGMYDKVARPAVSPTGIGLGAAALVAPVSAGVAGVGLGAKGTYDAYNAWRADPNAETAGDVALAGFGTLLGAKATGGAIKGKLSAPAKPAVATPKTVSPPESAIIQNPSPRIRGQLKGEGYTFEDLPIDPVKKTSPGLLVQADHPSVPKLVKYQADRVANVPPTERIKAWIGDRQAADMEGIVKGAEFDKYKDVKLTDYQTNPKLAAEVEGYFAQKYADLQNRGIKFGSKDNYLPQLWDNSPAEVAQALGKKVTQKPSFSFNSVVKNYDEGIQAGLKPKYNTVGELAQWYEGYANKTIADRSFFEYLRENKLATTNKTANNTVALDPNLFPVKITDKRGQQVVYYTTPDVAKNVHNYLGTGSEVLVKVADVVSGVKNITMTSGVPGTGWNSHGVSILARHAMSDRPVKDLVTGVTWLSRPGKAQQYIQSNLSELPEFARYGLKASPEEVKFVNKPVRARDRVSQAWNQTDKSLPRRLLDVQKAAFEDPLFQQVLPAMKLQKAKEIAEGFRAEGVDYPTAMTKASEIVNNKYGGLNTEQMLRNRDFQNSLRVAILAPDWLESTFRLGKGSLQSVTTNRNDPAFQQYKQYATAAFATYVSANLLQKAVTGHYMVENEPGKKFEIELPGQTEDGKKRYLPIFGTGAAMVQVPVDAASKVAGGNVSGATEGLKNRLSPLTRFGANVILGRDNFGAPIESPEDWMSEAFNLAPSYMKGGVDIATGKSTPEQGIAKALELPVRYRKPQMPKGGRGGLDFDFDFDFDF